MITRNKALGYIKREEGGGAIVTHAGANKIAITTGSWWIALTA